VRIILASSSPRRREIFALLGLPFEVVAPEFYEDGSPDCPPEREVLEFAIGKARSVAKDHRRSLVIGSDTMIVLEGKKIGKPADYADAGRILGALAGKTHRILTSVAILDDLGGPGLNLVEQVLVRMRPYSEADIERYLALGESLDKAGAYSIQGGGSALIESISGDYLAAVGLPLRPIARYLLSRGVKLPVDVDRLYEEKPFPNWQRF